MEGDMDYIDTTGSRHMFLMKASLLYHDICPEESRFLMQQHQSAKAPDDLIPVSQDALCPFCFEWRRPDNHHMRLHPKRRASVRVQSVLQKEARAKRLSLAQRNMVRRFRGSGSAQMATCHTCNNTFRHNGVNRDFIRALSKTHSTPRTSGKPKTPQSTNRTHTATPQFGTKDKPSHSTPRSVPCETTASSSGSKSASVKKSSFGHLKRLLKLEDNQKAKANNKGGLKDFLMSL